MISYKSLINYLTLFITIQILPCQSHGTVFDPLLATITAIFNPSNKQQVPFCVKRNETISTKKSSPLPQCSLPIESFPEGSSVPASDPNDKILPPWMNLTLIRRGQQFANNYYSVMILTHIFGLYFSISLKSSNDVLIFTHKSDNPDLAAYRYIATLAQITNWYQGDFSGLKNKAAITSIRKVREIHYSVSQKAATVLAKNESLVNESYYNGFKFDTALWTAYYKDLKDSNIPLKYREYPSNYTVFDSKALPVNQLQHALTQFAFIGFQIIFPARCGIGLDAKEDDFWAFIHLWAVIGSGLGIKDEFNICLQPDLDSTRAFLEKIYLEYVLPTLFQELDSTKVLMEAVLKGFKKLIPAALSPTHMMYRFLHNILDIPAPNLKKLLTVKETTDIFFFETQHFPLFTKNNVYRAGINTLISAEFYRVGFKYFNTSFLTMESRAEHVYFT